MEVLVRANSMAYNTTQPLFDPESDRLDGFDAGGRRWQRLRRFDRDPAPGGVFARVFTSGRSAVVAFKGICQPGGEQCIIDTCFLAKIQAYGALSKDLSRAFGAEDETCRRFAHLLNFEDQADRLVREVQQGLPGFSITLTGHSMGGMLAIVTAARQPKVLKALTFAPTPFHQALIQDLNWTEDQIQGLNADDLVATCDPFDCGVNSLYVEQDFLLLVAELYDQICSVDATYSNDYREYRKRCTIYRKKMELAGRSKETAFNIITMLTGKACDLVEDLDMERLAEDGGYDMIFERLDRGFKHEPLTELPDDFENFFVKLQRRPGETMQEYAAEFARSQRRLQNTHRVELPEKVLSWMFIRRAGVTKEQRQMVLTMMGADNMTLGRAQEAMFFIIGQDSKAERPRKDVYYTNDWGAEEASVNDFPQHPHEIYFYSDDDEEWNDQDEDYFDQPDEDYFDQPVQDTEETEIFDVEEYDEVYTAYINAKNQMNRMRTSRGSYPVVAMVDARGGSSRDKDKGKGKRSKGKIIPTEIGTSITDGFFIGKGKRNCPSAGEKRKRVADQDADINMVEDADDVKDDDRRIYHLDEDDSDSDDVAVQDGGAASLLASRQQVRKYLKYLLEKGVARDEIQVHPCTKSFKYGNSEKGDSQVCVMAPTYMGGKKRRMLMYVISGTVPILIGRPVKRMKWPHGQWIDIPVGPRGEHQLHLAEDVDELKDAEDEEILIPENAINHVDFQKDLGIEALNEDDAINAVEEDSGHGAGADDQQAMRQPDAELDSKTQRNQKALEVRFAGVCMENSEKTSRLTQKKLRTMITGAEKEIATQNRKVQAKFLDRVQEEEPDEILMAPMCRLWSQMQELSASRSPEAKQKLVELRRQDHNNVLQFVKRVYMEQYNNSREVTLEHPWTSRAWMTKAWHQLPGYETYVDQCAYGLKVPDDEGVVRPSKKPTKFLTTKKHLYHKVGRPRYQQNLQVMDSEINKLKLKNETKVIEKNKVLKAKVGNQVFGYVKRLHKNLGHPSAPVLKQMLMEVQATENVLKAAEEYLCPQCVARQRPGGVPPAAGLTSKEFNDRIVVDSAWIAVEGGRRCVLTIQDQATRYIAVRILKNEKAEDLIKGVERAWIKQFGIPKYLRTDEAKGWASKALREWTAERNIALEIAPAESHNWLGAVERKHQVVRRALELYMEDSGKKNDSGLLQACVYVPSQINSMSMVRGFTPQQWVMGKNPNQVQSLTGEIFSPTVSGAAEAACSADGDARLRRAMNQNYRQIKDDVVIGQVVYYWREKGAGILQKQKWRGPARVVATEKDSDYKDLVIWLAHGTSLLRCSPHQVRPRVEETGIPLVADPNAALQDLQALRARSTTQYKDVFDPTIHEEQDEDELDAMYEPEALDFDEEASPTSPAGSAEVISVPGVVVPFLQAHARNVEQKNDASEPRSRRASTVEPEPLPPAEAEGRGPASSEGRQSSQPAQPAEPQAPDGRDEQQDLRSKRQKTAQASDAPVDVPVPMQDDDDLMVEDVTFVDGAEPDLPAGWVSVDGEFASEKNMTADQRAQIMEAKKAENYFRNQVWNFAEVNPGDESRIVSARWVLTWIDKCLFIYYKQTTGEMKAILIVHVDDILLDADMRDKEVVELVRKVRASFDFGKWKQLQEKEPIVYCGGTISIQNGEIEVSFADYLRKVMPITVNNKDTGNLTDKEDVVHKFPKMMDDIKELGFVAFSDAAFGVRRDMASQGGYIIMACNKKMLHGECERYTLLSWRSFRLQRVCRSSLSAESQACSTALDELTLTKLFYSLMLNPDQDLRKSETVQAAGESAMVVDARALYDATQRETIQNAGDKRAAIQILCIKDALTWTGSRLRWVSSERQLADGTTKLAARQSLADDLRGGYMQLINDGNFTAAKKKTNQERKPQRTVTSGGSAVASSLVAMVANDYIRKVEGYKNSGDEVIDVIFVVGVFIVILAVIYGIVKVTEVWIIGKQEKVKNTRKLEVATQTEIDKRPEYSALWQKHQEQSFELQYWKNAVPSSVDSTEPGPCQNMPVPYQNGGWRESLGSGSDDMLRALPNLLCKTGAHDWARYEKLVLAQTGAGAPANVP
ncbi:unnamed protein product, partial [Effrenium voratum]